jgi:enoyl-CoA hydratase/carnithine racemase/acyl-coenzyme A synthetase/AMP-(fatty) acid ligase/NADPH:quinone reductase-like Zn-dependent oxidoreductase
VEFRSIKETGIIKIKQSKSTDYLLFDLLQALLEAVDKAAASDAKIIVFDGGRHLSADTGIFEILQYRLSPDKATKEKSLAIHALEKLLHEKIRALKVPTIALATGTLSGRGLGIAIATTVMITDHTTQIALPEVRYGFLPGSGATWFLPHHIGTAAAKYFALTGQQMSGKEAVGFGMAHGHTENVNQFVAELGKVVADDSDMTHSEPGMLYDVLEKLGVKNRQECENNIKALACNIEKHFSFGQSNQGYLGDIYQSLRGASRSGEVFAQETLAALCSANATSLWLTEFLIDTFSQEHLYAEEEAKDVELSFMMEMTGTFAFFEGVLGLKKGIVSEASKSHLDTIVLTDYSGFRTEVAVQPVATGSVSETNVTIRYQNNEYILPQRKYHAGEGRVTLKESKGDGEITLNIGLCNSQWSDQRILDELGEMYTTMANSHLGWRIKRRAWLTNPEKFELDMVYPYAWQKRPAVSLDLSHHPNNVRYPDSVINPARAIFDQLRNRDEQLLDIRKVIRIGQQQKGGKNSDVQAFSYRQIEIEANKLANVLTRMGVEKGDTVLIYMSTDFESMVAQLAVTLVGGTYHVQFPAKGADILSDTLFALGSKVMITEDGMELDEGRSKQLKKEEVDPVLERYMPKAEYQARLSKVVATLDSSHNTEAESLRQEIEDRLESKITYSRDAMQHFLQEVYSNHVKNIVRAVLDETELTQLDKALSERTKLTHTADLLMDDVNRNQKAFDQYASTLKDALSDLKVAGDIYINKNSPGDSEERAFAKIVLENWRPILTLIDDKSATDDSFEFPFAQRMRVKSHIKLLADGEPIPKREDLLHRDLLMSEPDFIIQHVTNMGIKQDKLISIDRLAQVKEKIIEEFERPYSREEKLLVFNRLEKIGLLQERTAMVAGRDLLWDDAIEQTAQSLAAEGKNIEVFDAVDMHGSDFAFLIFSSGTTGAPKGILLTVGAIVAGGQTMSNAFGLADHQLHHTSTDYGWVVGPAYGLWFPMIEGRSFTLQSFKPTANRLAQVVEEYAIPFLKAGSPVYEDMFKTEGITADFNLSSLRREGAPGCYGCAAPLGKNAYNRIRSAMGNVTINGVWRSEDFGAQHATFKRRPSIEKRSAEFYKSEIEALSDIDPLALVAEVRKPLEVNEDIADQLAFPWVNPVISESLFDDDEQPNDHPELIWDPLIQGDEMINKAPIIGQLSYAGAAPQRMVALLKNKQGKVGPVAIDTDLTREKYFGHRLKTDFLGKGREGERVAHDGGDAAYWVKNYYDETDPFSYKILSGPSDPVTPKTLYAAGRAGNTANVNGHLVNGTQFENAVDDLHQVNKSGTTFIEHATRERTPIVVAALKPGIEYSQDIIDDISRVIGDVNSAVKPFAQDIIILPAEAEGFTVEETYLPMTLTAKIMYKIISFLADRPLETLKQMQVILNNSAEISKLSAGKTDVFKQHELFRGIPDMTGLKAKASVVNLLNRIIVAREGEREERPEYNPALPMAEPYGNVPGNQIKQLGTKALRPGIDPVPPYQEAYGVARNVSGQTMTHRSPEIAMKKFIRETPCVSENGNTELKGATALVQMIGAGATHNVINGATADPVDVVQDKKHHVLGDAGVGQILALSPLAEEQGDFGVGQLVVIDPMIFNRQQKEVSENAQFDSHIGGYQGGGDQATLQAFAVFDIGNLIEVPPGMNMLLAGTLMLNGPTVEHALFSPDKLDVGPDDVVLIHGGEGATGGLAIDMLEPLGVKILAYVANEENAGIVRTRHPNVDIEFVLRSENMDAMQAAPVGDPAALKKWQARVKRMIDSIPADFRPTKVMQHSGRGLQALDFHLVKTNEYGGRTNWFSGAFGLFGTFNGHDARLDAKTILGKDGADLKGNQNILIHYGANSDDEGCDPFALEAIKEAARLGGHVAVLAETNQQSRYVLATPEYANIVGTRIQSVEALQSGELQGRKLQWPDHLPDIDEGRFDKDRESHQTWPGQEAENNFTRQTADIIKKSYANFTSNLNDTWDVIWDSGKRDHLALNLTIVREQTGVIVYGETSSEQVLTYSIARGWMVQRTIIVPSADAEKRNATTAQRMIRMSGSHMYEPHEAQRFFAKIENGYYRFNGPTNIYDADDIPIAFEDQHTGKITGSTALRLVSDSLEGITSERQWLELQGAKIVEELGFLRLLTQEVGADKCVATIEFKLLQKGRSKDQKTGKSRNTDLHWFRGDAVKHLRKLLQVAHRDKSVKAVIITADSMRAFVPGQNSDELIQLTIEEIEEMAAAAQEAMNFIENMNKPVVVDMCGLALGGGAELVAAGHYVVASNLKRTYFGQPETRINLIPGFGGTQRLVRIMADNSQLGQKAGLLAAADTLLTGQPLSAPEAYLHGVISELVPANSRTRAMQLAIGHALGTDDTLKKAMEKRHADIERWEKPMIDMESKQPIDEKVLTDDIYIQEYLRHGKEVGLRENVYDWVLKLMIYNLRHGVHYSFEAYGFGEVGSSSEFRRSITRFRNRIPIEIPLKRPKSEKELTLLKGILN